MKKMTQSKPKWMHSMLTFICVAAVSMVGFQSTATADETCMSPYMAKIVGQEDYVYIWTLGVEGLGDEQDKLVTVSVNPDSKHYGKVVNILSVGGRNEAHHSGLTDDRRYLFAGGLDSNKIFIFDVHTNPGTWKEPQRGGGRDRCKVVAGAPAGRWKGPRRPAYYVCATRSNYGKCSIQ